MVWFDFFAMIEKMLSEAVFALLLLQFAFPLECQVLGASEGAALVSRILDGMHATNRDDMFVSVIIEMD